MSVTVDSENLEIEQLGLQTVGQVLSHLQKSRRLVTHLLIDGEEPEPGRLASVRQVCLRGHTIFLETADPRRLAGDVLDEVHRQLVEAEEMRREAAGLLQQSQLAKALEKLSRCFTAWQAAEESLVKVASLLRIDLETIIVAGQPLTQMLRGFTEQLKAVKAALEQRDFVALSDVLLYEMGNAAGRWQQAIEATSQKVASLK